MVTGLGKAYQTAASGAGFFLGFLWGVSAWAKGASSGAEALVRAALVPGALSALGYSLLLAWLFWPALPAPRLAGVRAVVAPAAFTLSLATAFFGIRGTFWLLGA